MVRFSSLALLATVLVTGANNLALAQANPYSYNQNYDGYISGLVGPREAQGTGIYNSFQRGETHDFQAVYSRATSYDQNVAQFHWTRPGAHKNGSAINPAPTNYVIVALVGSSASEYTGNDYSTTYFSDLSAPYLLGNGSISAGTEVVRNQPYQCPACGPTAARRYYILKAGSYVANPNDTTATLTNAVVGQRYVITRFDYTPGITGQPVSPNPALFPSYYASRPIGLVIPHATPTITGHTTDAAGHATLTWSMAVEDPAAYGISVGRIPHSYSVRMTEDDSVTLASRFQAGLQGHRNKPFAAGSQYAVPAGYQANTSPAVLASTAPTAATYSFTFDRSSDIVERPGHYYTFQVTSNDASLGYNSDDSPASPTVNPANPVQWMSVTLGGFTATRQNATVALSWATSRELDNLGFEVQRSLDGTTWTKIGFVAGASVSVAPRQYTYQDAFASAAYYRLAQLNSQLRVTTYTGAQFAPLTVLATAPVRSAPSLSVYPNPASSGHVNVTGLDPLLPVALRNTLGQVVSQAPAGTHKLDISGQPAGIYLVQQGTSSLRLVIQ